MNLHLKSYAGPCKDDWKTHEEGFPLCRICCPLPSHCNNNAAGILSKAIAFTCIFSVQCALFGTSFAPAACATTAACLLDTARRMSSAHTGPCKIERLVSHAFFGVRGPDRWIAAFKSHVHVCPLSCELITIKRSEIQKIDQRFQMPQMSSTGGLRIGTAGK